MDNLTIANLTDFVTISPNPDNDAMLEVFDFRFNNISFDGQYNMTGDIGDLFDIYGDGPFWLNFINLRVRMPANLTENICLVTEIFIKLESIEVKKNIYR